MYRSDSEEVVSNTDFFPLLSAGLTSGSDGFIIIDSNLMLVFGLTGDISFLSAPDYKVNVKYMSLVIKRKHKINMTINSSSCSDESMQA